MVSKTWTYPSKGLDGADPNSVSSIPEGVVMARIKNTNHDPAERAVDEWSMTHPKEVGVESMELVPCV
ncbi:hypothetical protein GUJ93_ZPchr0010g7283 [Zizania palustris]|uniref:Uncharacterized protein n=1 Tax=Zizania palustris TaxID=103762 RepID=A0A8J5WEV1_ZIZPA|nr:hypothetical protein GUJ93_ZPchr0010g7283 [Zizania palustris]